MLVTLNRPASANAMNSQLGTEIMTLFESLNLDAGDTRCIVVTGAGDRAFCAGADLKERKDMTDEAWTKQHLIYERMVRATLAARSQSSPRSMGPLTRAAASWRLLAILSMQPNIPVSH